MLRTRARGGFIIVMDPRTGEILAMANNPVFNPNAYASAAADNKRNKAITDCFDPGSPFKPFLVAAAPVMGYGAAWIGHFVIEKNKPASFQYPGWSLRGDLRMLRLTVTGRLRRHLDAAFGS